jgi:Exo-beta-D-glucosaminidase Ig-fold domain
MAHGGGGTQLAGPASSAIADERESGILLRRAAGAVDSPRRYRVRRFAVPAGPGAGLLRRIAVAAKWHRRRPQRLLAVHPAGRANRPKTLGQPPGTLSQYVNLQALKTLQASVTATATTTHRGGPDGAGLAATVMITNTSAAPAVGFFLRADVRGAPRRELSSPGTTSCSPRSGSDNEITLWPGEWQTLTATYSSRPIWPPRSSAFRDGTGRRSTSRHRHRHRDVPGPGAADPLTSMRWR